MHAQFATVDITPTRPAPLAGYASRHGNFTTVEAPLEANLAAFPLPDGTCVVLGSVDTLFVGPSLSDRIAVAAGVAQERLVLVSTHTHNAPSLAPEVPTLGLHDPGYGDMVVRRLGKAVRRLIDAPRETLSAAYAQRTAPFNVNRRRPAWMLDYGALRRKRRFRFGKGIAMAPFDRGVVDPLLRCIVLRGERGSIRAVLWSYACHPAFFPFRDRVSPDFPGSVRAHLRRRFGDGCAVLYVPGFAGSAIPRIPFALPRSAGEFLARLLPFNPALPSFTPASYGEWVDRLCATAAACVRDAPAGDTAPAVAFARTRSPDVFIGQGSRSGSDVPLEMARLDFGPSCGLVAITGEMVGEWMPVLPKSLFEQRIATGYLAGPCLYVPTDAVVRQGGYEGDGFRSRFGLNGRFVDGMDRIVSSTLGTIFQ